MRVRESPAGRGRTDSGQKKTHRNPLNEEEIQTDRINVQSGQMDPLFHNTIRSEPVFSTCS